MTLIDAGKKILNTLNKAGYQAFFVGGFVRDQYLKRPSTDIDITTNAKPKDIESLFDKTIPTGIKYGTVTVLLDGFTFEVTTYRIDQAYSNHRQPEQVSFSNDLHEDLIRRDFTINALAQDIHGQVIDLFAGKKDMDDKIIRAIDDPYKRFKEDALRILRAIRFAGKLGFKVEEKTLEAMKEDAHLLNKIAKERILKELGMILNLAHMDVVYSLLEAISFEMIFQSLKPALQTLYKTTMTLSLEAFFALAMFEQKNQDISSWPLSNKQFKDIHTIKSIMDIMKTKSIDPYLLYQYPKGLVLLANHLLYKLFHMPNQKDEIENIYQALTIHTYKELKISGKDIQPFVKESNHIGHILDQLIKDVLNKGVDNQYDPLLKRAKEIAEALNERN